MLATRNSVVAEAESSKHCQAEGGKLANASILRIPSFATQVIRENDELYMVFEYMEKNIYQLTKDRKKLLPEAKVRNYIWQVGADGSSNACRHAYPGLPPICAFADPARPGIHAQDGLLPPRHVRGPVLCRVVLSRVLRTGNPKTCW